jgi:hypothetical protein
MRRSAVAADDGKPGVDVQVLTAGGVTTLDATSVTAYPTANGGGGAPPGAGNWGPSWPMMMPQTPVIVVTVDKKADSGKKDAKGYSEVFKRV